ncbi:hypothetical protein EIB18_04335 [Caulobacter vibrioides]|uniref:hypothetical protein n=1 Tax=Caulobacter vibrioides TaxID=155892 RepID=UPI000C7939E3|nr:hypothetical protein [Caulobacter vibrioides]AVG21520.1 hypothetical protein CA608_20135 [Caulobacter vibrioides]AZH12017.1 hypothetical protein EIB18_04335 [Caulobacter vibrioides]PLR16015.1 hypothetical protein CVUC_02690 [Caulobacter vibrioides]
MSTSQEREQVLHLMGIATATILALTAVVLAAVCPPQDLTPERARMFAHSAQGGI